MEENVIENEAEAVPENKFAQLGIAECQQVLERLKGGIMVDELPYAVKTLLDEYEFDQDTLRREVSDRKAELERYRKKAVELHIGKKYAAALEEYEAYFEKLGSQVTDYEAEQQCRQCRQYVADARRKKIQTMAAVVVVLILCGVLVDQVIFRKQVNAFKSALQERNYDKATETAIKISWRYDTEEGISTLVRFLDEKERFNRLCGDELTRASLDNYGGMKWQEVLELVGQADVNEELPQAIEQLEQASVMTTELVKECVVLETRERDFNSMYGSCNQMDADFYAHEEWQQLQLLREIQITPTNLHLITDRYNLMVDITNQVAGLMSAQQDMQPVKDLYAEMVEEEKVQVQGMLNYTSGQLNEAHRWSESALAKEELFQYADARLAYTRAIEHLKASEKQRLEDAAALAKIERAKREFADAYKRLNTGLAQERYPDDWNALSEQKHKAETEYAEKERWKGEADVSYKAALVQLRKLENMMGEREEISRVKEQFDLLYSELDVARAEKWFPAQWDELSGRKKSAEEAFDRGDQLTDVNDLYKMAQAKLQTLLETMASLDQLEESKSGFYSLYEKLNIGLAGNWLPEASKELSGLKKKADASYAAGDDWEEANMSYAVASQKLEDLLVEINRKAKVTFEDAYAGVSDKIKGILKESYQADWEKLEAQKTAAETAYEQPRNWEGDACSLYIGAVRMLGDIYTKGQEEKKFIDFGTFDMSGLDDALKPVADFADVYDETGDIIPQQAN